MDEPTPNQTNTSGFDRYENKYNNTRVVNNMRHSKSFNDINYKDEFSHTNGMHDGMRNDRDRDLPQVKGF